MESQVAHPHGYDRDHDHLKQEPHNVGLQNVMEGEDEQHHDKKSVLKKVKAKAKKIKDTLKLHGHGHNHDHVPDDHDLDEEDDDEETEEEVVDAPGTHRPAVYEAAAIMEDEGLKVAVPRTSYIKELPKAPANTPASITPGIRGRPEVNLERPMKLEEDPHAPKDRPQDCHPSNYETKVTDPTGSAGEEAGISPMILSFDQMNINKKRKPGTEATKSIPSSVFPTGSHDQFSPDPTPPKPVAAEDNPRLVSNTSETSKPQLQDQPREGSYAEKITSATTAIADKAISAKNIVVSKLGYGNIDNNNNNNNKEHEVLEGKDTSTTTTRPAVLPVEFGKKIAATITEKLTPVYEKVTEAGSSVVSKVHSTTNTTANTAAGNGAESNIKGQDRVVSMKDYIAEKLKPGEEDKALSGVITEALHKPKMGAQKEEKPMGKVTESEEVKRQLGSRDENPGERVDPNSTSIPGKHVLDMLKGAISSGVGKGGEGQASNKQSLGSSTGTEGFSSAASGLETGGKRLQESVN